jgi:hypothetical protein
LNKVNNFTIDITKEEEMTLYINQWVLEWVRKHHPEAFEVAETFVKEYMDDVENQS